LEDPLKWHAISNVRRGAVAAAASLVVATLMAAPAAAEPDKPEWTSDDPSAGSNVAAEVMARQAPLTAAAEAISALDQERSGLAGIRLQVFDDAVEVWWKGEVPGAVREEIAAQEKAGVRVLLMEAKFSGAQLATAQNEIATNPDRYAGLAFATPLVDGSGLTAAFTDPKRASSYKFPVPVQVQAAPSYTYLFSRTSDTVPWWGGAVTRDASTGATCSTGFAVQRVFGGPGLLTAAHCNPGGGHVFTNGSGTRIGPTQASLGIEDSLFIASDSSTSARIYDGGVGVGEFSKPVVGWGANFIGQFVCTSGAASGVHCNIRTDSVGGLAILNGRLIDGVVIATEQAGGVAAGAGDSGGPVFTLTSDPSKVRATGLVSFGVNVFGCSVFSARVCATTIGFTDIGLSLWMNWVTLKTQ